MFKNLVSLITPSQQAKPHNAAKINWEGLKKAHKLKDKLSKCYPEAENNPKVRNYAFQRQLRDVINRQVKKIQQEIPKVLKSTAIELTELQPIKSVKNGGPTSNLPNKDINELITNLQAAAKTPQSLFSFSDKLVEFPLLTDEAELALLLDHACEFVVLVKCLATENPDNITLLTNHAKYEQALTA